MTPAEVAVHWSEAELLIEGVRACGAILLADLRGRIYFLGAHEKITDTLRTAIAGRQSEIVVLLAKQAGWGASVR